MKSFVFELLALSLSILLVSAVGSTLAFGDVIISNVAESPDGPVQTGKEVTVSANISVDVGQLLAKVVIWYQTPDGVHHEEEMSPEVEDGFIYWKYTIPKEELSVDGDLSYFIEVRNSNGTPVARYPDSNPNITCKKIIDGKGPEIRLVWIKEQPYLDGYAFLVRAHLLDRSGINWNKDCGVRPSIDFNIGPTRIGYQVNNNESMCDFFISAGLPDDDWSIKSGERVAWHIVAQDKAGNVSTSETYFSVAGSEKYYLRLLDDAGMLTMEPTEVTLDSSVPGTDVGNDTEIVLKNKRNLWFEWKTDAAQLELVPYPESCFSSLFHNPWDVEWSFLEPKHIWDLGGPELKFKVHRPQPGQFYDIHLRKGNVPQFPPDMPVALDMAEFMLNAFPLIEKTLDNALTSGVPKHAACLFMANLVKTCINGSNKLMNSTALVEAISRLDLVGASVVFLQTVATDEDWVKGRTWEVLESQGMRELFKNDLHFARLVGDLTGEIVGTANFIDTSLNLIDFASRMYDWGAVSPDGIARISCVKSTDLTTSAILPGIVSNDGFVAPGNIITPGHPKKLVLEVVNGATPSASHLANVWLEMDIYSLSDWQRGPVKIASTNQSGTSGRLNFSWRDSIGGPLHIPIITGPCVGPGTWVQFEADYDFPSDLFPPGRYRYVYSLWKNGPPNDPDAQRVTQPTQIDFWVTDEDAPYPVDKSTVWSKTTQDCYLSKVADACRCARF